jgi:hypothetical protein
LVGFRPASAKELYYTAEDHRMNEALKSIASRKFKTAALFMGDDDSIVMLADVADEYPSIPMHINYAVGTPVEIAEIHSELYRCFIAQRQALVESLCDGEYKWPAGKKHLMSNSRSVDTGTTAMQKNAEFAVVCALIGALLLVFLHDPSASWLFDFDALERARPSFISGLTIGGIGGFVASYLADFVQTHARQVNAGIILACIVAGGFAGARDPVGTVGDKVGFVLIDAVAGGFVGLILTAVLGIIVSLLSDLRGR